MNQVIVLNTSTLEKEKCVLFSDKKKDFVIVFANPFQSNDPEEVDKFVMFVMNELYGKSLARGIKFFYDKADKKAKRRFAYNCMVPETLACFATSSIEVRVTKPKERLTPNIGHFVITACSADGQKKLLHFTYQVSAVYYLIYLITRRQKMGKLPVVNLARFVIPCEWAEVEDFHDGLAHVSDYDGCHYTIDYWGNIVSYS